MFESFEINVISYIGLRMYKKVRNKYPSSSAPYAVNQSFNSKELVQEMTESDDMH